MAARYDPIETLEEHWAIATFRSAERAELLAFAEDAVRALRAGTLRPDEPPPENLIALAGAFDLAARERLDLEGIGGPLATANREDLADRREYLRLGASRAFVLLAAAPLDVEDELGIAYRVLLLAGLAQAAGRNETFRTWLAQRRRTIFPAEDPGLRWDLLLLRRNVELWTEVLGGSGPSGLDRAMELVATIREERSTRERELLSSVDEAEEMRMRFYLFALFHLTEAATELLLYRLHGAPEDVKERVYVSLSLARSATAGDMQMLPALEWLYESAACVIEQRTPQLELMPESERNLRVH